MYCNKQTCTKVSIHTSNYLRTEHALFLNEVNNELLNYMVLEVSLLFHLLLQEQFSEIRLVILFYRWQ